jgi:glutathione S-transferase
MSSIKLILMYSSPFSERVRWAFTFKGVPYEKKDYRPSVDEEEVKKLTGQAQVPVLLTNGKIVPDSTAILNWLEDYKPEPALMPATDKERAQVMLWEELVGEVLMPKARLLVIGRVVRADDPGLQKAGDYFGQKYQHSQFAEEHAKGTVERVLTVLKHALDGRNYLVGDHFTRADLITACSLMLLKPAPDDLFLLPASERPLYMEALAQRPAFAPIFAWRDEMYRKHRGEAVKP